MLAALQAQADGSTPPEAIMQLVVELVSAVSDDTQSNKILLAPIAPRSDPNTNVAFPTAGTCIPQVQGCIKQLLAAQWQTHYTAEDVSQATMARLYPVLTMV